MEIYLSEKLDEGGFGSEFMLLVVRRQGHLSWLENSQIQMKIFTFRTEMN